MLRILFFLPWIALIFGATYWVIEVPGWASFLGLFVSAFCLALAATVFVAVKAAKGVYHSVESNRWVRLLSGKNDQRAAVLPEKSPESSEWGDDFGLADRLFKRASQSQRDGDDCSVWIACYRALEGLRVQEKLITQQIEQRFQPTELSYVRFHGVVTKTGDLVRAELRSRLDTSVGASSSSAEKENWAVVTESLRRLRQLEQSLETSDPRKKANRKNLEEQMAQLEILSERVKKFGDHGL